MEFKSFPSIPRLSKDMIVTEKLDWTNACIVIDAEWNISAQSRNNIITPDKDNYWFARWVENNKEQLKKLWEWYHYWEWWWNWIQRWYWMKEKKFSLFFYRWVWEIPSIVSIVPTIYEWPFCTKKIDEIMEEMRIHWSYATKFMNPEWIIIFHKWANMVFKKTIEWDEWKWSQNLTK